MKIGRFEIRWVGSSQLSTLNSQLVPAADLAATFAVPDNAAWWRALHQVIDQVREEAHIESENASGANEKMCAWAAAGAQHLGLLKGKFNQMRDEALRQRTEVGGQRSE